MRKRCTKCGLPKDESEFYTRANGTKLRAWCKACTNRDNVERAASDPEKANARVYAWRAANPGRTTASIRAWQLRHPKRYKAATYRYRFHIDFDAMWQAQAGLCASCHKPMVLGGKNPDSVSVDHDRHCCPGPGVVAGAGSLCSAARTSEATAPMSAQPLRSRHGSAGCDFRAHEPASQAKPIDVRWRRSAR